MNGPVPNESPEFNFAYPDEVNAIAPLDPAPFPTMEIPAFTRIVIDLVVLTFNVSVAVMVS